MKLLEEVQEILNKYMLDVLCPDEYKNVYQYIAKHPEKEIEDFKHPTLNDTMLCTKYGLHIPDGWYGFDIGTPTPINWVVAIDKILTLLIKFDKDLEIHQIKLKWGSICFYVESHIIEDIDDIGFLISDELSSNKMIY